MGIGEIILLVIFLLLLVGVIVGAVFYKIRLSRQFLPLKINPATRVEVDAKIHRSRFKGRLRKPTALNSAIVSDFYWLVTVKSECNPKRMDMLMTVPPRQSSVQFTVNDTRILNHEKMIHPYSDGQVVRIEYDKQKPRRCNILTPPNNRI